MATEMQIVQVSGAGFRRDWHWFQGLGFTYRFRWLECKGINSLDNQEGKEWMWASIHAARLMRETGRYAEHRKALVN